MTSTGSAGNRILKQIGVCGAITLLGYIGLFCLMQSPVLWYDLRPDPIRSLFPAVFGPINQPFPDRWVNLERQAKLALLIVPLYIAVVVLITAPLLYLLRKLARASTAINKQRALLLIFGFTLAIMVVLLFLRGLLSSDIYTYDWYSRIWAVHGVSPYTHAPADFAATDTDGSFNWVGWPKQVEVYGPAWVLISGVFYKLGQWLGNTFSAQLLSLRLLADIAHLVNAWLVWAIAGLIFDRYKPAKAFALRWGVRVHSRRGTAMRRTGRFAGRRVANDRRIAVQLAALLFYIWNPLVVVEFAGSGHNDVVMITFVLLALWLYLKGWWRIAALALGVATLVKLPSAILVPGYLWLLLWEGARHRLTQSALKRTAWGAWRAVQAVGLVVVAWAVLYLPFWEGTRTLQALLSGPTNNMYLHSIPAVIWTNLPQILANFQAGGHERNALVASAQSYLGANLKTWGYGVFLLAAIAITWRARSFQRMLTAWGWLLIAILIVQIWFWPWYVTWLLVPAAFSRSTRLRTAALVFSVSALFNYVEEQVLGQHFSFFLDWSGALITLPVLVYLLVAWRVSARHKSRITTRNTPSQATSGNLSAVGG